MANLFGFMDGIAACAQVSAVRLSNYSEIKTKKVINNLRVIVPDIAWVGIDIEGTNAYVNVVEKTKLPESAKNENTIGDIISDKSGIIEKIVAENGTPILSAGEYVENIVATADEALTNSVNEIRKARMSLRSAAQQSKED